MCLIILNTVRVSVVILAYYGVCGVSVQRFNEHYLIVKLDLCNEATRH